MRVLILVAALTVMQLGTACTPPPTIQTPAGQAAYTADQVVMRLNELQNTAIQANAAGALDLDTTRKIVQFVVSSDKVLATAPAGWQALVRQSWAVTKTQLPTITNQAVLSAISTVEVVLAALGS